MKLPSLLWMLGLLCDCAVDALTVTGMTTTLGQVTCLAERWLVLVVTLTSGPEEQQQGATTQYAFKLQSDTGT